MNRIYISRWVAMVLWMALVMSTILAERMILVVTFDASRALLLNAYSLTVVSYVFSWVASMIYKSSRDTAINEMGRVQLQVYKAAIEEALNQPQEKYTIKQGEKTK